MSYRGGPKTLPERVRWLEEQLRRAQGTVTATVVISDHGLLDGLGDDDHPQYQREVEKGVPEGYASLDAGGTVPAAQLPANVVYTAALAPIVASAADVEMLLWLTMGMEA